MTSMASISSVTRMAPSWAVNRQPIWAARPKAVMSGASSRVLPKAERNPASGPRPTMSRPW